MERKIIITAESVCDIPKSELERLGVQTLPLHITIGENSYLDYTEIDANKLFELTRDRNTKATTAAVAVHDFENLFRSYQDQNVDILHISAANTFSACCANAISAAEAFPFVHVFNSHQICAGQALAIYRAADLREQGKSVEEIIEDLTDYVNRIQFNCVLDTVEYARKGGRVSATVALGIELLKVKPEIIFSGGVAAIGKKYRGKFEKIVLTYIEDNLRNVKNLDLTRIILPNTLFDKEFLKRLRDIVASYYEFGEIILSDLGSVVSCHAGPNAFGLAYVAQ